MKKLLLLTAVLLLAGFLAWRFIGTVKPLEPPKAAGRPPVAVDVAGIIQAPIQEIQQLTGAVFPGYRYVVASRVPGRILEITKRIGDRVREGEVIVRLDDAEYRQAVAEADADLRIARAAVAETKVQMELATQELGRVRSLAEKKIASLSELDKASADRDALDSRLKLAEAQIEQREAALASSRIRLGYAILGAPRSGFVGERYVDEGSMLASNTPVLSVIGMAPVIVRTTVIERLYGRVRVGQPTRIEVDAYPGKVFSGKVARIAPILQEESRVAEMEVEIPNNDLLLKPGMFARLSIVLSEKDVARVVPTGALVSRNGGSGVFVIDEAGARARYVPVRVGISTPRQTEILSPVIEGKVVIMGQHLLEDGSPVVLSRAVKGDGA